jgi:hypothetical protein
VNGRGTAHRTWPPPMVELLAVADAEEADERGHISRRRAGGEELPSRRRLRPTEASSK